MKKIFTDTKSNWIATVIVVVVFIIVSSMLFTIKEYEKAAAFQFGKYAREYNTPGLKVKAPWPFETVYKVDTRLQLHSAREMTIQEKTKKKLLIDYFTLYRIERPKTFFTKIGGNMEKAIHRLDDNTGSDVAAIIGESSFDDIVTNKRQQLLDTIQKMSNRGLEDIDLKIYFMSFNRVELPDENKAAVFRDMINDRNKISSQYRSEGQMVYDSITSNADFLVADIIAKANRTADSIKGRADQERIAILNKGYAQSAPLFRIYNEIETYKKAYTKNTEWILDGKTLLSPPQ
jgi:membrane protease subunit HflC